VRATVRAVDRVKAAPPNAPGAFTGRQGLIRLPARTPGSRGFRGEGGSGQMVDL
jgi:hypothetical protein